MRPPSSIVGTVHLIPKGPCGYCECSAGWFICEDSRVWITCVTCYSFEDSWVWITCVTCCSLVLALCYWLTSYRQLDLQVSWVQRNQVPGIQMWSKECSVTDFMPSDHMRYGYCLWIKPFLYMAKDVCGAASFVEKLGFCLDPCKPSAGNFKWQLFCSLLWSITALGE